jgi:Rod binding domain-containing protein
MDLLQPTAGFALHSTGQDLRASHDPRSNPAEEFEALLVQQILASARRESATDSTDSGSDAIQELAENLIAKSLASAGGFGIAHLIRSQAQIESAATAAASPLADAPQVGSSTGD